MQRNIKGAVAILIGLAVIYYAFPLFYETFNYYPPIKEDMPYRTTVQVWNTFTNQRVTLDTEVPPIPADQFPVYQGKFSSNTLNVSFNDSNESYDGSRTWEINFLIENNKIVESKFNLANNTTDLQLIKTVNFQTADFNDSGEYIVQQIRYRNVVAQKGNLPMFSLGRIRITDVKFVYFNGFDTYSYRYEGKTTYYPAWKVTVETSNYGNEILMVRAF